MVGLMNVPPGASMPALLRQLAGAEEFSGICLRRSEKKVLNAINRNAECVRYHVEEPSKPGKATARIKTAAEKIFILVRTSWLLSLAAFEWTIMSTALLSSLPKACK